MEQIKDSKWEFKAGDEVYVNDDKSRAGKVIAIEDGYAWVRFPDNENTDEQYPLANVRKTK